MRDDVGPRRSTRKASEAPGHALSLLRGTRLTPHCPVSWGTPVASVKTGVYLVELDHAYDPAPVDHRVVRDWLAQFPAMALDGKRPSVGALVDRLGDFWLPSRTIVYIGRSTRPIGTRVGAYYRTPIGERSPHRGGYWVKTLSALARCRIWWAETDAPRRPRTSSFTPSPPLCRRPRPRRSMTRTTFSHSRTLKTPARCQRTTACGGRRSECAGLRPTTSPRTAARWPVGPTSRTERGWSTQRLLTGRAGRARPNLVDKSWMATLVERLC